MAARVTVVGLVIAIAAPMSAPAVAQGGSDAARARWRDGGMVMSAAPDGFMSDASTSGVFVGVGVDGQVSTIARRAAGGQWRRVSVRIGAPVGVDVNDSGNAVVLSLRATGAVLSTSWPHGARRPHTDVILAAADSPKAPNAELVANGRGDLAAFVTAGVADGTAVLVRRPLHKQWGRPVTVRPGRYDGALDSIDVGGGGQVIAAFRKGAELTSRVLRTGKSTFGPPTRMATWHEPGQHPAARGEHADIAIGRSGDVATLWSYRLDGHWVSLLDVLPTRGRRFQARIAAGGRHDLAAVGDDGSVLLSGGLRWNPKTRRLVDGSSLALLDADSRGDALMGAASHRGDLALWPIGGPQQARVAAPRGQQVDAVLTTDLVVYLVIAGGPGSGLQRRTRQF
jgi:hypothetical protein